jgi:hypothetical protein
MLFPEDRIVLGILNNANSKKYKIEYQVLPPKSPYQLPGEIGAIIGQKSAEGVTAAKVMNETPGTMLNVTDDLVSGGKLKALFYEYEKDDDKNPAQTIPVLFQIKSGYPLFIPSTGVVFSNESNHTIAVIANSDGKSIIVYKDKENTGLFDLRPKEDLIQFFNFRLYEGLYLSVGFPLSLSKKMYENPHAGLSFYPGQDSAFLVNVGVAFHKEQRLLPSSGYVENQVVADSLKAESLPTESPFFVRFYLGLSFRLK